MKESSLKRHRLGHPGLCRPLPRWPAATHMDAQPPGGGQQETGACAVTTPHATPSVQGKDAFCLPPLQCTDQFL